MIFYALMAVLLLGTSQELATAQTEQATTIAELLDGLVRLLRVHVCNYCDQACMQ